MHKSTIHLLRCRNKWLEHTGLQPGEVSVNPACVVPVPNYVNTYSTPRRFSNVNPQHLWHPLFWLPPQMHSRFEYTVNGQTLWSESDSEWAVRIALEATESGLYQYEPDENGQTGWLDVLSLVGVDVTTPEGLARVEAWQRGQPDVAIDEIDLSGLLSNVEREWALHATGVIMEPLRRASWAWHADDLIGLGNDLLQPRAVPLSAEKIRALTVSLLRVAELFLVDATDDYGVVPSTVWADLRTKVDGIHPDRWETVLDGPVATAVDRFYQIREAHWDAVDQLVDDTTTAVVPAV